MLYAGRPVLGAIAGFFFFLSVAVELVVSPVLALAPSSHPLALGSRRPGAALTNVATLGQVSCHCRRVSRAELGHVAEAHQAKTLTDLEESYRAPSHLVAAAQRRPTV